MSSSSNTIVQEFLLESFENLASIVDELTKFEKDTSNKELLDSIFRKIHTLKGSASFLGFKKLEEITHNAETVLDLAREGKYKVESMTIDTLLDSLDSCLEIIKNVEKMGVECDKEYSHINFKILGLLEKTKLNVNEVISEDQIYDASAEDVEDATEVVDTSPPVKKNEVNERFEKEASELKGAGSLKDSVVRVNVNLLDKIMNCVGELVLNRNQILQFSNNSESSELNRLAQELNGITTELQTDIMTTRMQPVGTVVSKFERIVRDLSRKQNKNIKLKIYGSETELDKTLLDAIRDPLTHLVRNAVDHGIEKTEDRVSKGKSEEGLIQLKSYHEGGQVTIEITDDGGGIDPEKIKAKAIEKGIITAESAAKMSEKDSFQLIFAAGFSTAAAVTDISGRGVGMDVVKTNIEKVGGSVDIDSTVNVGTVLKLKIPLTLAIVPALMVVTAGDVFAIPQANLVELVRLEEDKVKTSVESVHGVEFIRLRGSLIPIFRLDKSLNLTSGNTDNGVNIVILNAEGFVYGIIVDEIIDTQEIVVKPLSQMLKKISLFAGATILGDGKVALIVDALGFYHSANQSAGGDSQNMRNAEQINEQGLKTLEGEEVLLFTLEDERVYGIPLCLINRLEEFSLSSIEWSGDQPLVQYRGKAMPLVDLEKTLEINKKSRLYLTDNTSGVLPCVVFEHSGNCVGFIVSKINDIAFSSVDISTDTVDQKGFFGTTFIDGRTITILDSHAILMAQKFGSKLFSASKHDASKKRILLAEDSALYQRVEVDILEQSGYHVTLVENGSDAYDKLSHEEFDLLITDIEMPIMNGYELCEKVRSTETKSWKDIPIIALTTRVSSKDLEKGEEVGLNGHLKKLDRAKLITEVKKYI